MKARLVAGEVPTTLRMTMQQTPTGGSQQFFTVAQATNATDAAWVTLTGTFSYGIDVTGLLLYVEATTATASYYIDSFTVTETIPPPAVNILHDFEDGTLQGWIPRGGSVMLTNTTEAGGRRRSQPEDDGPDGGFPRSEPERARRAPQGCDLSGERVARASSRAKPRRRCA